MNSAIRNILAVVAGIVVGTVVNGMTLKLMTSIIPPPSGSNLNTMEGLNAAMASMEPKHFIGPFLSHALGTLVGAFITAKIAATHKTALPYIIGGMFFVGGLYMVTQLSAPMWFNALDLVMAYFPMAYLGIIIGAKNS
jgi:hypothetical protein